VKLNIFNTSTATLKQMLLDHELDVALTYKSPMDDDRIESCLLFQNSLCLIGRRDALKDAKHVEVQTLSRYPLALPIKGLQARDTLESVLFAKNIDLDIRLELNSIHAILDLVKSGSVFTILSGEVAHGIPELRAVPIHHPEGKMYGCYHSMKGTYRKKATETFIRILTENNSFRSVFR
jgi:LysR family cyn operon transcriptional activator